MRWRCKAVTTSLSRVPTAPGIYAYGYDAKKLHGLDAERVYVYIGESDNLRRRLEQHLPANEPKSELRKYLRENLAVVKCWYCPMDGVPTSLRREMERELIQFFDPEFNDRGK